MPTIVYLQFKEKNNAHCGVDFHCRPTNFNTQNIINLVNMPSLESGAQIVTYSCIYFYVILKCLNYHPILKSSNIRVVSSFAKYIFKFFFTDIRRTLEGFYFL